jgi:hypothetical protein
MVDLAQVFSLKPVNNAPDRLPPERYEQLYDLLCQSGIKVCRDDQSMARLRELRGLYEGYATAMSRLLQMPLPPWIADHPHKDNWQTVARLRAQKDAANPDSADDSALGAVSSSAVASLAEHHHDIYRGVSAGWSAIRSFMTMRSSWGFAGSPGPSRSRWIIENRQFKRRAGCTNIASCAFC